ncbi:putative aliphatic sulfonates-binding protein [Andreprevotia sp. IGB-42]|uniref:aliphatic sulfonate ABC transporter substrate-binding protein n=1 Tax=Andreprevotia sp. IGB-42 TaxID=2497473 RepID=UPI00157ED4AA|nr:aliphatic sulfonate ABC transporter substrate-binding protein [Andreprevotia sp. IGB-42]KAF0815159.1 putative aliphatic sulfonates-binding protein [Andreprevotia sp. IGB-42]
MHPRLLLTLPALLLVILLGLALAANSPAATPNPKLIRIGIATAGVGQPPRITAGALAQVQANRELEKEFEKDGTQIEWVFFKGEGPAVNEALSNKQLDFALQGDLPAVVGRSVGLDTRLVLVAGSRATIYLAARPDAGINSVADLRGKRIAFHKGTATQLAVNRILATAGLSERDVRVVNLDPAASLAAFKSGDLDAIFGGIGLLRYRDQGLARLVFSSKQMPTATTPSHLLVVQPFAQAYPEATKRVVKVLARAAHWVSEEQNRDTAFKLWASAGSITEAMYQEEYQGVSLRQRQSPQFDPFIVARDKQAVEDAYRFKLIRKKFDVDQWIDSRYLDAALKELKLENYWPKYDANGNQIGKA